MNGSTSSTKEKILRTAFDLFTERSYEEVTIDEIADEAEVSKGAVFHHFDSKYRLARESFTKTFRNDWLPLIQELKEMDDPDQQLDGAIEATFELFLENPKLIKFGIEIFERGIVREENGGEMKKIYSEAINYTTELFEEIRLEDARARSHLLWGSLDGIALQHYMMKDEPGFPSEKRLKSELKDIFLDRKEQEKKGEI